MCVSFYKASYNVSFLPPEAKAKAKELKEQMEQDLHELELKEQQELAEAEKEFLEQEKSELLGEQQGFDEELLPLQEEYNTIFHKIVSLVNFCNQERAMGELLSSLDLRADLLDGVVSRARDASRVLRALVLPKIEGHHSA